MDAKTPAEVLAMADDPKVHFMTFKAEARRLLPSIDKDDDKDQIIAALQAAAAASAPADVPYAAEEPTRIEGLVSVKLLKNYRPGEVFEIVGHEVPAELFKNPKTGIAEVITPAHTVYGEPAPAPVQIEGKLWANTIVRLPKEEARTAVRNNVAERGFDD